MIRFYSETKNLNKIISKKTPYKNWITTVILNYKKIKIGDINLIFCDDEYLLSINKEYLNHDYYTDIITFDYSNETIISGDLYISIERVDDNAKSLDIDFNNELNRVIIHGILHLLGYKDKSSKDKSIMTTHENKSLLLFKEK